MSGGVLAFDVWRSLMIGPCGFSLDVVGRLDAGASDPRSCRLAENQVLELEVTDELIKSGRSFAFPGRLVLDPLRGTGRSRAL